MEQEAQPGLTRERRAVLEQLEALLETPMLLLGVVWLVLLMVELLHGTSPLLERLSLAIWVVFLVDFGLRLALAPDKGRYLARNVVTLLSLAVPALRLFRLARFAGLLRAGRAARGMQLVKVLGSLNRGMRALSATLHRRRVSYVAALTVLVLLVGAAGIYAFERDLPTGQTHLPNYGTAVWWTAMLLTTIGSEYWPQSAEGRVLCLLLSVYSLGVLGYLTAALASFFIGRDAADSEGELVGAESVAALHSEIVALRQEIAALRGVGRGTADE